MSRRSVYLRDQAAKCEAHAKSQTAPAVIAELRRIAAQYLERAEHLEGREAA